VLQAEHGGNGAHSGRRAGRPRYRAGPAREETAVRSPLRIAATVLGALFALQGLGWLLLPARAAEGLGMPLLDGLGRSTQIGDLAAFFLALGATTLLGVWRRRPVLLQVAAGLLGAAALGRTLAWALHGAPFAGAFVAVEVAAAAVLLAAARR
jgi:hypothetical protein